MTGRDRPFVSVVVPVRNGAETLGDCLASILATDFPEDRREVLVVDNGSSDGTAEVIRKFAVRCVIEPRRGLSNARNRGIAAARGEILAFTDADCVVAKSWLRELTTGFDDPEVFAVAGEMIAFPPTTPAERYFAMRKPSHTQWALAARRPWFMFASAAVRSEAFERVGLFDPWFKGGSEDIDIAWRFYAAGLEVRSCPQAVVFHRNRTKLRQLFRQQLGSGGGQALLLRKYRPELRWTLGNELSAWRDILTTGWVATRTYAGGGAARHSMHFYFPFYDFIRKLGQRLGFLYGLVGGQGSWRSS
ncbi:MAG: glycosyltransferase [Actinomycetota bacterium]|nr:glycosyltransferase [Actinomycetota bacterium]